MRVWHLIGAVLVLFGIGMGLLGISAGSDRGRWAGSSAEPRRDRPELVGDDLPAYAMGEVPGSGALALAPHLAGVCPSIELRVLVLAADGDEATLPAIRQALEYQGTPYSVWLATERPGALTPDQLAAGCQAHYQAVILANADLVTAASDYTASALTDAEWQTLRDFEAQFGVRQVNWFAFPRAELGFQPPEDQLTSSTTVLGRFTDDGRALFRQVNTTNPLTISGAHVYLARPLADGATPLLVDERGYALAGVYEAADGRETLSLTFDSNVFLPHNLALAYDLVHWATRGLFLGVRSVCLSAQVDDVFIANAMSAGGTYRISGADLGAVVSWQKRQQARPLTRDLRLDLVFVAFGTTPGRYRPDTLTPEALQFKDQFKWINHTYGHVVMTSMDFAVAKSAVEQNDRWAEKVDLPNFSTLNLVTPEVSGLGNAQAMRGVYAAGVRYLVSDTSRDGQNNPSPNAGIYHPMQPGLLMIPRYPTNLGFPVSTPNEWVNDYNGEYRDFWGRDLNYEEILDKESDVLLSYLLKGDMNPLMFHQANLRAYDGSRSLLGDLLNETLEKYAAAAVTPVLSPVMDDLGRRFAQRMAYNVSGARATLVPGESITLHASRAATVPVTGLATTGAERYSGDVISYVALEAGQTVTLPLR